MLDAETKRRIDTARDILVGKVPDPKSQVEQITIALIYKFMDDMDAESEEFGGARKFFAGDFSRYGWAKLMRAGLGGYEMLSLYAEAITKMPENSGIPPLFRDIFKNAFLPYRDPETLRAFLKIIDEFTYDHSERLGDAFEYLLSVLGSQGDAGQFRTPRHIIDFIVAIIDPKKDETILDPACGTAGFLISSFKHILKSNSDEQGHTTLTPVEKGRLAANFKGYDISPDMVRLSLVNLYLHGFADPHIFEYDTLTSEDRWSEYADVILTNPPFMSPKGGIRPHNRFSVQSKRSEVLFVDYMAEHLTPSGRAGIIVPEGIIFQSQNAHKQLRKVLVENYLVAVISLPAGVFQPYSGVKTSILILDKVLAKKTDCIGFFKVENDGFDLGAQRRPIDKNDLPHAHSEVARYMRRLKAGESVEDYQSELGLIVKQEKIAADGEYNLSGERYRKNSRRVSEYPSAPLFTVARIVGGNPAPQESKYFKDGKFPFIRTSDVGAVRRSDNFAGSADKVNQKAVDELQLRIMPRGTILFPKSGASTFLNHRVVISEAAYVSSHLAAIICDEQRALPKYVYYLLCQVDAREITPDQAYPSLRLKDIGDIRIPKPPLDVQEEIVTAIEGYQKVIDGARAVIDNYRLHIPIDPAWPLVELGEHFSTTGGGTPTKTNPSFWHGKVPWVSPKDVKGNFIFDTQDHITEDAIAASSTRLVPSGSIVCVVRSGILKHTFPVAMLMKNMCINQDLIAFTPKTGLMLPRFLLYLLKFRASSILQQGIKPGLTVQSFLNGFFRSYRVPLPPIAVQRSILDEMEAEQNLIGANRKLIERFERKIQSVIAQVWAEDLPPHALK